MNENVDAQNSEDPNKKPLPDWGVSGDNQNLIIGLIIVFLAVGGLGLRGCLADGGSADPASVIAEATGNGDDSGDASDDSLAVVPVGSTPATTASTAPETTAVATTEAATTAPATSAPATTAATTDLTPDVEAAVAPFGGVEGVADGTTAVLTGFVDSAAQSTEAETAAAAVEGIEAVDNQLVTVDSGALDALSKSGVSNPLVEVKDLTVTASGTIESEDARQPALDAVAAAPGVAGVVDKLTVAESMTDSLNALVELQPVQFATSSDEILPESNETLDAAAAIINEAPDGGNIEVQGYTDIRGSAEDNQRLSEERAAAVVQALIDRKVPAERLTSKGFGGTTEFDEGTTEEAYAANRRVIFAPVDAQ